MSGHAADMAKAAHMTRSWQELPLSASRSCRRGACTRRQACRACCSAAA